MVPAVAALPEQMSIAAAEASAAVLPEVVPSGVAVVGMGGSGVAGDVLAAVAGPDMVVPVLPVKGYELPACVSAGWLVLAVSFSGETEEVLSATQDALERDVDVIALTRGGSLEAMVGGAGGSVIAAAADVPQPRAAIAALSIPGLVLVDRLGLVPEDAVSVEAAAAQAARRRDECLPEVPFERNPAKQLAAALQGCLPVFYGGGPVGSLAAYRAKCDVNENAKCHAFAHGYPELCHNEVCGWARPEGHPTAVVVQLRTGLEHPQVSRRMDIVARIVEESGVEVRELAAEGKGALARLFDLVTITQWASLYLAFLSDVDPGPIPPIDRVKAELG